MVEAEHLRHHLRMEACLKKLADRTQSFRSQAATLVTPEDLAALDERLKVLPDDPGYHADFWRRVLKGLGQEPREPATEGR
jgi:hypothetical protein